MNTNPICRCGCGAKLIIKPHHFWCGRRGPVFLNGHNRKGSGRGTSNKDGYVRVTRRGNVNQWRYLHRVVVEENIGRPLRDGEIVHHINGDRGDNRLENLKITDASRHIKDHWKDPQFRNPQVIRLTAAANAARGTEMVVSFNSLVQGVYNFPFGATKIMMTFLLFCRNETATFSATEKSSVQKWF